MIADFGMQNADFIEGLTMASRQWNPGDLLEISGFYWKTAVLHAAVKLDVFTVIGDGQLAASEISRQLNAAQRGLERLLDALVAMELLVKVDGNYANSAFRSNLPIKKFRPIYRSYHYAPSPPGGILVEIGSGGAVRHARPQPIFFQ